MANDIAPQFFRDDLAVAARAAEVPLASFETGMNNGGSCACGIGINGLGGAVVGTPEQFTLLDQRGIARIAQISQSIGGYPYAAPADYPLSGGTEGVLPEAAIGLATVSVEGDGAVVPLGSAQLIDLAGGWTPL